MYAADHAMHFHSFLLAPIDERSHLWNRWQFLIQPSLGEIQDHMAYVLPFRPGGKLVEVPG